MALLQTLLHFLISSALRQGVGKFDAYRFFAPCSGSARNGKQFGCGHTPKFLLGRGPAKMLVGEPPQTRLFGTKCPKEVGCVTAAVAPVPYYSARLSDGTDD